MRQLPHVPSASDQNPVVVVDQFEETQSSSGLNPLKSKNSDEVLSLGVGAGSADRMSLFTAVNMIVGMMIGSGIFASSGPLLQQVGSTAVALVMWTLSGVVSLFGALAYAELGTLIKQDGGEQIYLYKTYGELMSYLFVWFACMIGKPCSIAIVSSVFGTYVCSIFNIDSALISQFISILLIISLTVLNSTSSSAGLRLQDVTTVSKLVALYLMIAIGSVFYLFSDTLKRSMAAGLNFEGSSTEPFSYVNALYLGLWAFDGFNSLNLVTSEVAQPEKNLPKAIIISLLLTVSSYVLANLTYFFVLSKDEIVQSTSIAVDLGRKVLGPPGGIVFMIAVAISCVGTANGSLYTAGRLFRASAEASLIPFSEFFLDDDHGDRIPRKSIMFQGILSCVFVFSGSYEFLVRLYGFTAWIFYTITGVGVLLLRRRNEFNSDPHAYRAPLLFIILFIISGLVLIIVSFTDPEITRILLGCLVAVTAGLVTLYLKNRYTPSRKHMSPNSTLYHTISDPSNVS